MQSRQGPGSCEPPHHSQPKPSLAAAEQGDLGAAAAPGGKGWSSSALRRGQGAPAPQCYVYQWRGGTRRRAAGGDTPLGFNSTTIQAGTCQQLRTPHPARPERSPSPPRDSLRRGLTSASGQADNAGPAAVSH
ncbi:GTP-binding protein [Platysternon megacephalum]|uniref:GTP-binding protein n=1 Tax=Platysternon megacephalum TaxID=55544 RepID=A0A4D9DL80_9SAUR|nr:GTP-binding protein [Platysternon megacephalum]